MYLCKTQGFVTFVTALRDEQLHDVTCAWFGAFPPALRVKVSCIVMSIAISSLRSENGTCYCCQYQPVASLDDVTVASPR